MFSNVECFRFSAFIGHSVLSGRSIVNTKKVTQNFLQVIILYHWCTFCIII